MRLVAKQNKINSKWVVELRDVETFAVVEVRIQNTMTGKHSLQLTEADHDGKAPIDLPDFGQQYAITLRVLSDNNALVIHRLYFDHTDNAFLLSMSSNPETIGEQQTNHAPVQVVPVQAPSDEESPTIGM